MKKTEGFTLIELMIVVAILAILAIIALPAYQNYLIRSQVAEGAELADGAKTALATYYSLNEAFPISNVSAGLASPASILGHYVAKVDVGTVPGIIEATYNSTNANKSIRGKIFALSAVTSGGSIQWSCKTNKTTVDSKYLPSSCR